MIKMFPNGYIVQQIEECPYHNIWRRCTWPLELYEDVLSVQLSDEADEKWFGYNDGRPLTIPSKEYIHRYTEHCRKLGINYIILFVESTSTEEGIKPLITTAFWGKDEMFSNDSYEEMMDNGGDLLTYQVMDLEDACDGWEEFYDMTEEQIELLKELYWQRIEQLDVPMKLTKEQIKRMGKPSWGGKKESKESFAEIGIQW